MLKMEVEGKMQEGALPPVIRCESQGLPVNQSHFEDDPRRNPLAQKFGPRYPIPRHGTRDWIPSLASLVRTLAVDYPRSDGWSGHASLVEAELESGEGGSCRRVVGL